MKHTLNHIQDSSLNKAIVGLDEVLSDLKEGLGEKRFKNEYYIKLLNVFSLLNGEYFRRQRKKAGL